MAHVALPETRLLHSLLRLHGRAVDGFSASFLPDGSIRITAPHGAAFYPGPGWTSRFLQHLYHGYFDSACASGRRAEA